MQVFSKKSLSYLQLFFSDIQQVTKLLPSLHGGSFLSFVSLAWSSEIVLAVWAYLCGVWQVRFTEVSATRRTHLRLTIQTSVDSHAEHNDDEAYPTCITYRIYLFLCHRVISLG